MLSHRNLILFIVLSLTAQNLFAYYDLRTEVNSEFSKPKKIPNLKELAYVECFKAASKKEGISLQVLSAIAKGESNFNPTALSKANAVGIMQIQWPGTAKDLGFKSKKELYEPCRNIKQGSKYFRYLLRRYKGDYYYALAAYNYGPGRIKYGHTIPKGAKGYVAYIFDKYDGLISGHFANQRSGVYKSFDYYFYAKNTLKALKKISKNGILFDIFKKNKKYDIRYFYKNAQQRLKIEKMIGK